jgi:threonine/homoserine/homoserine lactone efflux protein
MITLLLQGAGYATSAALLPGGFQTFTISNALRLGWHKTLILCITPIIVDAPLIVFFVFIAGSLPSWFLSALQLAGGVFLLWIARGAWLDWRHGATIGDGADEVKVAPTAPSTRWQLLRQGVLLNYLGPGPYLFWSTVNGPILANALKVSVAHGLAFLIGFYGTFFAIMAVIILAFDRMGKLDARVTRWILLGTILLLVVFALLLIRQGLFG